MAFYLYFEVKVFMISEVIILTFLKDVKIGKIILKYELIILMDKYIFIYLFTYLFTSRICETKVIWRRHHSIDHKTIVWRSSISVKLKLSFYKLYSLFQVQALLNCIEHELLKDSHPSEQYLFI